MAQHHGESKAEPRGEGRGGAASPWEGRERRSEGGGWPESKKNDDEGSAEPKQGKEQEHRGRALDELGAVGVVDPRGS